MSKKDKHPNPKEQRLTPKQELFCQHYVDIGIASEAYRLAYDCSNMKQATVWRNASAMLSNNKVSTRIKEIEAQRAEESKVERKIVEKVLMDIIQVDPAELYIIDEATGKVRTKNPTQMPKRIRNALKKIKNKRGEVTYEFNGKVDAARLLASMNSWEAPKEVNMNVNDPTKKVMNFGFEQDDEK